MWFVMIDPKLRLSNLIGWVFLVLFRASGHGEKTSISLSWLGGSRQKREISVLARYYNGGWAAFRLLLATAWWSKTNRTSAQWFWFSILKVNFQKLIAQRPPSELKVTAPLSDE